MRCLVTGVDLLLAEILLPAKQLDYLPGFVHHSSPDHINKIYISLQLPTSAVNDTARICCWAQFAAVRYDKIRDAILMCARKPMWVSLIYCTLPCAMMWCPQRLGGSGCHCRMISPAGMALSSKLAAAACEWCDGQTDRHPTSFIEPALHTTLAVQIIHMLSVLWSACLPVNWTTTVSHAKTV